MRGCSVCGPTSTCFEACIDAASRHRAAGCETLSAASIAEADEATIHGMDLLPLDDMIESARPEITMVNPLAMLGSSNTIRVETSNKAPKKVVHAAPLESSLLKETKGELHRHSFHASDAHYTLHI